MLKHVLVPLDGSTLSEQALDYAKKIVAEGGQITLLSVMEVPVDYEYTLVDIPMTVVSSGQFTDEEYNTAYHRIHNYLTPFARRLGAKGYTVQCVVESGDAATVINDVATNNAVEAIVMTTHGRTGLNRWLFGSVTQKVISQMLVPVFVVPWTVPQKIQVSARESQQIPATG